MSEVRTFHKLPSSIRAVEVSPGLPLPEGVTARQNEDGGGEVWNGKQGSWIGFKIGDFLRIDLAPEDVYPIAADYMAANYEPELPESADGRAIITNFEAEVRKVFTEFARDVENTAAQRVGSRHGIRADQVPNVDSLRPEYLAEITLVALERF